MPVVPPPALLSAPQLSRPAPARARRPRAPVGVARARGCPLPAGARGTPRDGAAGSSGSPRSDLVLGAAEGDEAFPEPAPLRTEPAPSPQPPPTKIKRLCPRSSPYACCGATRLLEATLARVTIPLLHSAPGLQRAVTRLLPYLLQKLW